MSSGSHDYHNQTPFQVLGVGDQASDKEVRAAYLRKIRQFPPDQCPDEFERVRDAYEMLQDRWQRAKAALFAVGPEIPTVSLLDGMEEELRFVRLQPWLKVVQEKPRRG